MYVFVCSSVCPSVFVYIHTCTCDCVLSVFIHLYTHTHTHTGSLSEAEMCHLLLIINRVIESGVSLGRSSDELEDEEKQDEEDETMVRF